jgi:hydrogenase 3 maturation protease
LRTGLQPGVCSMNILFGVGNPLSGDDGIGNYTAEKFHADGWTVYDCGTVPENFTSLVRKTRPPLLVIVDAADLGLSPGEFRVVPEEYIEDVSIGTHQLPLTHVIEFLKECTGEIIFIGIQPRSLVFGTDLSSEAISGADRLIGVLEEDAIDTIPEFKGTEGPS